MQHQNIYLLALAGFGAATTTLITESRSPSPPLATTICLDLTTACGSPPTTTLWYGGCHDITVTTTYTPPPCPTGGSRMANCTSTGTICDERYKTCGSPIPTTTLAYGICHDACVVVTYSPPPCPVPTTGSPGSSSSSSSCTNRYSLCEDYVKTCGSPSPTAYLTYGGCHGACEHPTYSPPPCPTQTATV